MHPGVLEPLPLDNPSVAADSWKVYSGHASHVTAVKFSQSNAPPSEPSTVHQPQDGTHSKLR